MIGLAGQSRGALVTFTFDDGTSPPTSTPTPFSYTEPGPPSITATFSSVGGAYSVGAGTPIPGPPPMMGNYLVGPNAVTTLTISFSNLLSMLQTLYNYQGNNGLTVSYFMGVTPVGTQGVAPGTSGTISSS